ncbi:DegV domain-containing protein [Clostridium ljungdahlii]|uniref:DegV domain-containing protein n=2 Tax=Clostridium ljungdahlii TaxID=1538 RepID=A0A162L292_9CLOT|nr:DegV domain-containing protein [Clostridium ljungdahlii]
MTVPIIMTDASCDLPGSFMKKNNIQFLGLMCHFKNKDYEDDFGKSLSYEEFYKGLENGEMPYTSQINEYRFTEKFKELLKQKRPIIYIGMSSGISGTFNSSKLAKNAILSEFEDADITLIDSKSSSIGLGILVYYACKMAQEGLSKDEIVNWVNNNRLKMNHWFVVEDLKHLKRGGRISSSKAIVGTLLDVKPIIYIENQGELKNVTNVRGRKKAIKYLVERFRERALDNENQVIGISHGNCIEDAKLLKNIIEREFPNNRFIINMLGVGMAAHCGSGMLSLCFLGNKR